MDEIKLARAFYKWIIFIHRDPVSVCEVPRILWVLDVRCNQPEVAHQRDPVLYN